MLHPISSIVLLVSFSFQLLGQDDCVFDNNYEQLGIDWITDSNPDYDFLWDSEEYSYYAPLVDGSVVELKKGGCHHFFISIKYIDPNHAFDDKEFWLVKAQELSKTFHLDYFLESLQKKSYAESETQSQRTYLITSNEASNLISEGIIITKEAKVVSLELSYYYN